MYVLDELHFATTPQLLNHPEEANICMFPFTNQDGKHDDQLHITADAPGHQPTILTSSDGSNSLNYSYCQLLQLKNSLPYHPLHVPTVFISPSSIPDY